jgi:uncharacterized Ntn-hydrolase superfamily protein
MRKPNLYNKKPVGGDKRAVSCLAIEIAVKATTEEGPVNDIRLRLLTNPEDRKERLAGYLEIPSIARLLLPHQNPRPYISRPACQRGCTN